MITSETAKILNKSGLKWEPQEGDAYYCNRGQGEERWVLEHIYPGTFFYGSKIINYSWTVFAPRLDQLLTEIEKQGYFYSSRIWYVKDNQKEYWVELPICLQGLTVCSNVFNDVSIEEAAAKALLWILAQEQKLHREMK